MWIIYNIHTFIYSHIYMQVLFIGGTCMTLLSAPGPHTFHGTPAATATSCQASEEETGSGFKRTTRVTVGGSGASRCVER